MLHFTRFEKSYGTFLVLTVDNLRLPLGIYWIKGHNGSGKSTLLKAIAGILAFEGDIILQDTISVKKQKVAYRRAVNFAEAEPLYPEFLTGQEMIALFSSAKGAPRHQEDYFINSMQMNDYIHQPIKTYSSGMLKKLSLVLAFLGHPQLILLDEPLITIDQKSLSTLYRWITEKHQRDGTSFLLSSHQSLEHELQHQSVEILVENQTLTIAT